jgi:hypothetical protein
MPEETIGKITTIDPIKGTLVIDSWDGKFMSTHPFHIVPELDLVLKKQKPGYFVQITHEGELAKNIKFANKPDNWPQGKGNFKPRNEKPTIYESAFKTCAELVRIDDFPGKSYAERIESVRIEADKIARWMVTESGEGK